ncbi:hypothetical protein [Streptomyces glaucus]|uniref:Flavin reductase like domain-containing protein n=1 Tax=Streptomyces glaucus TaxID=284029 RepID=A0ABN3JM19_9ACTN
MGSQPRALAGTGECAIPVPRAAGAEAAIGVGNCSGADADGFQQPGLTALDGEAVEAPLIAECRAGVECVVADTGLVDMDDLFPLDGRALLRRAA